MKKDILETFVSFENHHLVVQALQKGKGTFFISGHISNWELTAFAYARIFRTHLNIVAKTQSNKFVNRKLNEYRELSGNEILETGSSLRPIFQKILQNEIVCFLVDQSAPPDYSVYSKFFNTKVSTFNGPAKMALKYQTELLFAYGVRSKNYKYYITLEKIEYDDIKEYSEENIQKLTDRINEKLESVIRQYPDQWLWIHRRFKHIKDEGE